MYTIKQAALRAGVSVQVLRAWERRYGIVRPDRTPSGYRLYDETAIDRVRAMRQLVEDGWSASQAALQIEAHGVPASPAPSAPSRQGPVGVDRDVSAAFVKAAAELDGTRVEAILDDVFASGSFERVIEQRLMPALRALGDAWAQGTVSVAAEHAASHAVLRRLSAAFEAAGRLDVESPVLVGLPPGSRHELGALAFATAARRRGIGVVYLGADVPEPSWRDAANVTGARGVVIGIPTAEDREAAEGVAHAMTEMGDMVVAVGGLGAPDARIPAGVIRLPNEIPGAIASLEQALEGAPAGRRS
jgi:MerR family transcriptional regulator, light-induced transcriptional regulator